MGGSRCFGASSLRLELFADLQGSVTPSGARKFRSARHQPLSEGYSVSRITSSVLPDCTVPEKK